MLNPMRIEYFYHDEEKHIYRIQCDGQYKQVTKQEYDFYLNLKNKYSNLATKQYISACKKYKCFA